MFHMEHFVNLGAVQGDFAQDSAIIAAADGGQRDPPGRSRRLPEW